MTLSLPTILYMVVHMFQQLNCFEFLGRGGGGKGRGGGGGGGGDV